MKKRNASDADDYVVIGDCIECDGTVIELYKKYICSNVVTGRGCNFTISKEDIYNAISENIIEEIFDAVTDSDYLADIMSGLLTDQEGLKTTWHMYDGNIYEYYVMSLVKTDAGLWELKITRDDPELEALAKEGYLHFYH